MDTKTYENCAREFTALSVDGVRTSARNRRIALSGVSGSGKTTTLDYALRMLSNAGVRAPRRIDEVARSVFFSPTPVDNVFRSANQLAVIFAQVEKENGSTISAATKRGFVSDRSLYDCVAYLAAVHPAHADLAVALLAKFKPHYDVLFYFDELPRTEDDSFRNEFLAGEVNGKSLDRSFKAWLLSMLPSNTVRVPKNTIEQRARVIVANLVGGPAEYAYVIHTNTPDTC